MVGWLSDLRALKTPKGAQSRGAAAMIVTTGSATFGQRLRQIRKHRGLSRVELAAAIGKSDQAIAAWERGDTTRIAITDLDLCAQALKCRRTDWLAPVERPVPPCPYWAKVRKRLQRIAAARAQQEEQAPS
jgi:transcriptional regulator with XRE-family HTH domain